MDREETINDHKHGSIGASSEFIFAVGGEKDTAELRSAGNGNELNGQWAGVWATVDSYQAIQNNMLYHSIVSAL